MHTSGSPVILSWSWTVISTKGERVHLHPTWQVEYLDHPIKMAPTDRSPTYTSSPTPFAHSRSRA